MLNGVHFYHATIKRIVSVFGTIFNNIVVGRHSGNKISNIMRVPISYGPKEKFLARINQNLEQQRVAIKLPRMSFEITAIEYDTSTKLNRLNKTLTTGDSPGGRNSMFQSVPYTLGMQLNIMSKNQEDALQILEQILPTFSPEYTVAIKDIEGTGSKTDVPFILNSVSFTDDYESDMITRRTIIYTLDFTVRVRFAPDTSKISIIKKVETAIADFTNVSTTLVDPLSSIRVSADSPAGAISTFVSLINPDDVQTINLAFKDFTLSGLTPLNSVTAITIASGNTDADRVVNEVLTDTLDNLAVSSTSGSGSGATFNSFVNIVDGTTNEVAINTGGSLYTTGDTVTISEAPYNNTNLVLNVASIDSTTPIDYSTTSLSGSISGTAADFIISKTGATYTISSIGNSTGFAVDETITVLGTLLGGATTANDATITVTAVTAGEITAASITGTGAEEGSIASITVNSGGGANTDVAATFNPTFSRSVFGSSGTGTGLKLDVTLDKNGTIVGVPTIVNGGTGYTASGTETISASSLGEDSGTGSLTDLVVNIVSVDSSVINGTYIRSGVLNNRPRYVLTGNTNMVISYNGNAWELIQGNIIVASKSTNAFNVPTSDWGFQVAGKDEEAIAITSTDTGDFTIDEAIQGSTSLGLATIISSSNDVITANGLEAEYTDGEVLTGLTSGITRTAFNTIIQ